MHAAAMYTVADHALRFVARARAGEGPALSIQRDHAAAFLGVLAREGFGLACDALEQISDPKLRNIVETLFWSTAGGAVVGASIGFFVAGPIGAQWGAGIGAGAGLAIGVIAITLAQRGDRLRIAVA